MALFDERFDGWQEADFAAFLQKKWASNRFNLERGRVRLRLMDLLGQVRAKAGLDVGDLQVWTSPDHPKLNNGHKVRWQAAAWCRPEPVRRAMERFDPKLDADDVRACHVHLGVVIEAELARLILVLPKGAHPDASRWEHGQQAWTDASTGFALEIQEDGKGRRLERVITREEAIGGAGTIDEIAAWMAASLPALRAVLWQPTADSQGGRQVLENLEGPGEKRKKPTKTIDKTVKAKKIAPAGSKTEEPRPPRRPRPTNGAPRSNERSGSERRRRPGRGPGNPNPTPDGEAARPSSEDKSPNANRPASDRPRGDRPRGDRPRGNRPGGDRPGGDRPRGDRPRGDRPRGDRPRGDRPRGDRPQGGGRRGERRPPPGPRTYEFGPTRDEKSRAQGSVAVGATVVLNSGLFAGKQGQVTAIQEGRADVTVGSMTVHVAVADLSTT